MKTSLEEARSLVPFDVQVPQGLGRAAIYTTAASYAPKEERLVAFVFKTSEFGLVDIVEGPPETTAQRWPEFVANLVATSELPDVFGRAKSVTLDDGTLAFMTISDRGVPADITWQSKDASMGITVEGPSLNEEQAERIANDAF